MSALPEAGSGAALETSLWQVTAQHREQPAREVQGCLAAASSSFGFRESIGTMILIIDPSLRLRRMASTTV
jgi:hypothetical protein